jgi:hypothetical protein
MIEVTKARSGCTDSRTETRMHDRNGETGGTGAVFSQ